MLIAEKLLNQLSDPRLFNILFFCENRFCRKTPPEEKLSKTAQDGGTGNFSKGPECEFCQLLLGLKPVGFSISRI